MVSLMKYACDVMMHDVMIKNTPQVSQIANMVRANKSHNSP